MISTLGGIAIVINFVSPFYEKITISRDYFNPWSRFETRETFDKNPSTFSSSAINTL